jgi:predicted nucleic-acid-binding protein
LEPIVNLDGFVITDKDRYIRALDLFATSVPHFGDACACAAALEECEGRVLSFDKKLAGVEGVRRSEELG